MRVLFWAGVASLVAIGVWIASRDRRVTADLTNTYTPWGDA